MFKSLNVEHSPKNYETHVHIGESNINTAGRRMTIVLYNTSKNLVVQFEDGTLAVTQYANFQRGAVQYPGDAVSRSRAQAAKLQHIGETAVASNGMTITIIAYRNNVDVDVQFEDGAIASHVTYQRFCDGCIGHPSHLQRAIPKQPTISVAECYPENVHSWHPVRNGHLTPMNTPAKTTHKIWWECESGHEWQATPTGRARYGCPICVAQKSVAIERDYKVEEEQK